MAGFRCLLPRLWQIKERGIEVAALRVWHQVRERALEVGRVAQELAGEARDWVRRVAEGALEALEPAPDALGRFRRGSCAGRAARRYGKDSTRKASGRSPSGACTRRPAATDLSSPGRELLVKRTVGVVVPIGAQSTHDQRSLSEARR